MLKTFKMEKLISSTTTSQKQFRKVKLEKAALIKKGREEIAEHLRKQESPRAKNKVLNLIQETNRLETMDILEFYCNTLHQHAGLIKSAKKLDPTLAEAVSTVIWAAPRLQTEVPELTAVSDQLFYKYGREYGQKCRENKDETVNPEVFQKLSVGIPNQSQMVDYLTDICSDFNLKKGILVMGDGMYDSDGIYGQRRNPLEVNGNGVYDPDGIYAQRRNPFEVNGDGMYEPNGIYAQRRNPFEVNGDGMYEPNEIYAQRRNPLEVNTGPSLTPDVDMAMMSESSESGSACTASSIYEDTIYYD